MQRYLRQGELNFAVGYKLQTRWGATEAAVFTLECAGAALFAGSLLLEELRIGMVAGIALVALAIVLLLAHLGNSRRAWKAILNMRHSWISRGTLVLGGFVAFGVAYLVLRGWAGLDQGSPAMSALRWVLLAAAVFIPIYPGLVLSASPAIPFWNSGLLPVLSFASGTASALALLLALATGQREGFVQHLAWIQVWLLVALALILAVYVLVMASRGAAAAESAGYLLRGHPGLFAVAGCGLGIGLPLLLTLWIATGGGVASALALAAIARVAGDLALRYALLKVGMFNPVV